MAKDQQMEKGGARAPLREMFIEENRELSGEKEELTTRRGGRRGCSSQRMAEMTVLLEVVSLLFWLALSLLFSTTARGRGFGVCMPIRAGMQIPDDSRQTQIGSITDQSKNFLPSLFRGLFGMMR